MSEKVSPETLALRAKPRPVTRLNRRMLVGVVAILIVAILGVTVWSLKSNLKLADVRPELHNVERVGRAEGLDKLPPDYSKVTPAKSAEPSIPILGKPLPGDLGMAMLRTEQRASTPDPNADAQRAERAGRQQELEEAAKAPLFFRSATQAKGSGSVAKEQLVETSERQPSAPSPHSPATSNVGTTSKYRVESPSSPYQLMAGTVISGALLTGINSDLPGIVLATVTEPVYDTKVGRHLLIPQGTRLIGEYDSQVAFGQRRVLLVWNRLIFPDASSLTLDRLPGADPGGNAGVEDGVDRHWRQLLAGAALSTLIGVAAELASPNRTDGQRQVVVSAQQSLQDSINQVGQQLTRRNLDVQPTLTVRPGYPVRVIVSKDLVLKPYQPLFINRATP